MPRLSESELSSLSQSSQSSQRKRKQSSNPPSSSSMTEAPSSAYQQSTITDHFSPRSLSPVKRSRTGSNEPQFSGSFTTPTKEIMKPITQATMFNFGSAEGEPINISSSPIAPSSPTQAKGKCTIKPPPFQTHSGAPKKLKIKNLRTSSKNKAEEYFNNTWKALDSALSSIFRQEKIATSMEELYRGVENICRSDRSPQLFETLQSRIEQYVETDLQAKVIESARGRDVIGTARVVEEGWEKWSKQLGLIRSIFLYLDRSYLFPSPSLRSLEEEGQAQFRKHVATQPELQTMMLRGTLALFEQDRDYGGNETLHRPLLQSLIKMITILGLYPNLFEPEFVEASRRYYSNIAVRDSAELPLGQYVLKCSELMNGEGARCEDYRLEQSTKRQMIAILEEELVGKFISVITAVNSVKGLLENLSRIELQVLYELLNRVGNAGKLLKPAWEAFIMEEGTKIVSDKEHEGEMVSRLLNFKGMLDQVWSDPFMKNEIIGHSLRETFTRFINARRAGESEANHSKPAEMIAKYVDQVLRSGTKGLPPLTFETGDHPSQDDDAEIAHRLELVVDLFRFISGKDVFEAFYKKDLARRLLMSRSASVDAERLMLTKLKTECGAGFTHNLESMFKDMDLSKESVASFKATKISAEKSCGVDLHVNILSSAAWPTYPEIPCNIPPSLAEYLQAFQEFYVSKHSGRKLMWRHGLSHCILKADFPSGKKELIISAFQAIVLLHFANLPDRATLTYQDLLSATNLPAPELTRTLQSLSLGKHGRVLLKSPKGRKEISPTDQFCVNLAFTDPKFRVKINQVQLKETKEENKETHERVAQDRQFETQAAVIRVMKSRKRVKHVDLVQAVIEQTKGRGVLDALEIKKNIERLIEKDYMERVVGETNVYDYVA